MAKRQRRIPGHEINDGLKEILNQPLSLVLKGGEVFFVHIKKIMAHHLSVEDQKNGKWELAIENIQEIIIDFRGNSYAETSAH